MSLGRLSAGPKVGYLYQSRDGFAVEPFVGVKGIWDFDKTDQTAVAGINVSGSAWRGLAEAGASLRLPSGITLNGTGSYDGIGDGAFHAYQGQLFVRVPLD